MSALMKDIASLGTYEKLQLVEDLWDSIEEAWVPEISDETYAELERRAAWSDAHPGHEMTLEQIAEKLGIRL